MHTPGEHVIVIGTEANALRARAQGLVLRDTVTILLPGVQVVQAFLFRVPLEGTVADTVLRHGQGGLNIDECRVGHSKEVPGSISARTLNRFGVRPGRSGQSVSSDGVNPNVGRWPTNLLLVHGPGCQQDCQPDCSVRLLGEMSGNLGVSRGGSRGSGSMFGIGPRAEPQGFGDSGDASRFYPQFPDLRAALDWLARLVGSHQAAGTTSADAQCPQ